MKTEVMHYFLSLALYLRTLASSMQEVNPLFRLLLCLLLQRDSRKQF